MRKSQAFDGCPSPYFNSSLNDREGMSPLLSRMTMETPSASRNAKRCIRLSTTQQDVKMDNLDMEKLALQNAENRPDSNDSQTARFEPISTPRAELPA